MKVVKGLGEVDGARVRVGEVVVVVVLGPESCEEAGRARAEVIPRDSSQLSYFPETSFARAPASSTTALAMRICVAGSSSRRRSKAPASG